MLWVVNRPGWVDRICGGGEERRKSRVVFVSSSLRATHDASLVS